MKYTFVAIFFFAFFTLSASAATTLMSELVSASTDNTDASNGIFRIRFSLTASGGDIYVPDTGSVMASMLYQGNPADGIIEQSLVGITDTSSGGYYVVPDGTTNLFEYTTNIIPNETGLYQLKLDDVLWYPDQSGSDESHLVFGSEYHTSYVSLVAPAGVPEPSRALLVFVGLASLMLKRRKI